MALNENNTINVYEIVEYINEIVYSYSIWIQKIKEVY